MEPKIQSPKGDIHLSSCAHREEFPSQAFNLWYFSLKGLQGTRLGQHTKKACTWSYPAPSDTFRSTKLSVRRSEDVTSMILKLPVLADSQLESPQNPPITGLADPLDRIILGTYPFEPRDRSALSVSECGSEFLSGLNS